jgi:hypothetical protein
VQGELGVGEHVVALVMAVRSKGRKEIKEFGRVEGEVDLSFSDIADDELCERSGSAMKAMQKREPEEREKRTAASGTGNSSRNFRRGSFGTHIDLLRCATMSSASSVERGGRARGREFLPHTLL